MRKKIRNQQVKEHLYTAIIYCNVPQVNGNQFLKYRRIDNRKLEAFEKFARQFPGAVHVNYYGGATRQFIKQTKL